MTRRNGRSDTDQPPDRGDLGRLLDVERTLAAELATVRTEARQLIERAEAAAHNADSALEHEVAAERGRLREAIEAEVAHELDRLAAETRGRVAAFQDVAEERIAELAEHVIDRVVAG